MKKKKLRRELRRELEMLWSDLDGARCRALAPHGWSIDTLDLVRRIKHLTRLVGPTAWQRVPIGLLARDGWYQVVHAELGIPVDVDHERVLELAREYSVQGH